MSLKGPHLFEPRVSSDPARRARNASNRQWPQIRVVQSTLVDGIEQTDEVVNPKPDEAITQPVAISRRHVTDRHVSQCARWRSETDADIWHVMVLLQTPDGSRPVLLYGDVPLRELSLVDVAPEDAGRHHLKEVLPQPVGGHIRGPEATSAAARQIRQDLLDVATTSKAFPTTVHLRISFLDQAGPRQIRPILSRATERIETPVEGQGVVDLDIVPLPMFVQTKGEEAQARVGELHVCEDVGNKFRLHADNLHASDQVEVFQCALVYAASMGVE
mmetsp:Transcript_40958/g.131733  ORF Transcript_40958/g.131733 Transcript_40958/m.131733 type:complete len:274 (-) Transcript_40958:862-1683(-)